LKNLLFIFICFIAYTKTTAQVVFCPHGAEWHYRFFNLPTWGGIKYYQNVNFKFVRDSVIAPDTIKILSHPVFYEDCNHQNEIAFTLIKQKRDTVFFKNNKTQNTWQILYNYACTPGNGWQTTILNGLNSPETYSYVVSAVNYTNINGFNLKVLDLGGYYVTERLGRNDFLFYYSSQRNCDGYYLYDALCYSDSVFGIKKFTDKDCYFAGIDGIKEYVKNTVLKIFPNPVSTILNIESENQNPAGDYKIYLANILGEEIFADKIQMINSEKLELDLDHLQQGIYFLQVFNVGRLVASEKIIKE
jgi:hypothetical protein